MATKIIERQNEKVVVARVGITATGLATAASTTTIALPPGTMLMGGIYHVIDGASGTSPTLTMVDNASSPNTLFSAVAIGTDGAGGIFDEAAEVGNYYPSGAVLSFTTGGTDTPAGGDVLVAVRYIVIGRCDEIYGVEA